MSPGPAFVVSSPNVALKRVLLKPPSEPIRWLSNRIILRLYQVMRGKELLARSDSR